MKYIKNIYLGMTVPMLCSVLVMGSVLPVHASDIYGNANAAPAAIEESSGTRNYGEDSICAGEAIVTFTVPVKEEPAEKIDEEKKEPDNEPVIEDEPDVSTEEDNPIPIPIPEEKEQPEYTSDEPAEPIGPDNEDAGPVEVIESITPIDLELPENKSTNIETKSLIKPDDGNQKHIKPLNILPYIIGTVVAATVIGAGVSGGFSALWILLLGIFCKKKKKHWSGLLTHEGNWAMTVKGASDDAEDMQDILDKGISINELRTMMVSSGIETILPVNTKMSIDIEGVENEFDADEEVFYQELEGKRGHCAVTFFNGAARLNFTVEMDLG